MNRKLKIVISALLVLLYSCKSKTEPEAITKPNIVIIYLDDLGYGDLSAYGATEINTPNIDKLANGGVRFTQGYATSATCTPSRYALLTGEYPWRNQGAKILSGSAPLIIDTAKATLPRIFKKAGYHTGIVGKWHLGLGNGNLDWNKEINPGPNQVGFDYSVILAATQDRVPTIYIENGYGLNLDKNDPIYVSYEKNFEGEPTGKDNPELTKMKWHHGHNNSIVNGIPRIGFMKGGKSAHWSDVDMADFFLNKATQYVKAHKDKPFFLYYALQQPHVPRTPNPRFVGKSGMGPRGDAILEADWCIGEFVKALETAGILENTLIVFSSDNGPALNDGYFDDAVEKIGKHKPSGVLRGGKFSLFDAGTRVPLFTYWKGKIKPKVSDALVCQIDFISSFAKLVDISLPETDSKDMLDVLLGKSNQGRENLVIEANSKLAFRKGGWVYIPPYPEVDPIKTNKNIETGCDSVSQLYNLNTDIGQQHSLVKSHPEKLKELMETYQQVIKVKE